MTEYIERDMLCRVLERYRKAPKNRYQRGVEDGMELALNAIKAIHAADVAPVVHGRWIVRFGGPYNRRRCYCSHCGKHNGVGGIAKNQEKPYCPNCGAKMDGGDSDEADRR